MKPRNPSHPPMHSYPYTSACLSVGAMWPCESRHGPSATWPHVCPSDALSAPQRNLVCGPARFVCPVTSPHESRRDFDSKSYGSRRMKLDLKTKSSEAKELNWKPVDVTNENNYYNYLIIRLHCKFIYLFIHSFNCVVI